jgi:hypothetical protein
VKDRRLNKDLWLKYKAFEKVAPLDKRDKYGNAMKTIGYFAQGEASDWMAISKGLFAFSPELGNGKDESKSFYPAPEGQIHTVEYNFKIVKSFLSFHIPKLQVFKKDCNSLTIGLSSMFPIQDLQFRFDDLEPVEILLNGQSVKDTMDEIGLRFGDRLELQFSEQGSSGSLLDRNWKTGQNRISKPRTVSVRMGRMASKVQPDGRVITAAFEIFATLKTTI